MPGADQRRLVCVDCIAAGYTLIGRAEAIPGSLVTGVMGRYPPDTRDSGVGGFAVEYPGFHRGACLIGLCTSIGNHHSYRLIAQVQVFPD